LRVLLADGVLAAVGIVLLIYCVLEIISTPETAVRNLPKLVWLLLVIVLPLVGSIAWLVAGRPQVAPNLPYKGNRGVPPEYDRPGRATASSPDDDAAFLRRLKERADAQREEAKRQREEQDKREDG
jgi:hypothetical protein